MNIAGPHSWRVIHMDRSEHPKDLRPTYLGDSIGKWDGDTLVIDSVGFNEKIWPFNSYPTTSQLHLMERFSRPTLGSLVYEMTIDDPGAYTAPWTGGWYINWQPDMELYEYVCQDNNRDVKHMFGGPRN